jgi:hypothetical protein
LKIKNGELGNVVKNQNLSGLIREKKMNWIDFYREYMAMLLPGYQVSGHDV